jgi:type 1 glutamine amidotransferase
MFAWIYRERAAAILAVSVVVASLPGHSWATEPPLAPRTGPIRVLVLSGEGEHDWRATTPFLHRILTETGRFDVRVCEVPNGLTPQALAEFDVLVDNSGALPPNILLWRDKAVVLTHAALARGVSKHEPGEFRHVRVTRPEHPVMRGLGSSFRIADALPVGIEPHKGAEVLAEAQGKSSDAAKPVAVLFASAQPGERLFGTALGHDLTAMQQPEFISTFVRGTEWAATGNVTLPADIGLSHRDSDSVRGLVITGGHDHITSFYTLFEGYKDLARMPVASSKEAFQSDLRSKYDVLVMYDFSRDLDETGKQNLRQFVASGKGIVVLHHALLNYQDWRWWLEEVVGGSYRLKRDGNAPSSTVKDSQRICVTPSPGHPVTAGIGPFLLVDEAYRRMWFSPRIQPLLSTDNPESDPVVAWVGPCATSRVVAIQLGHGPSAFEHPSYRALVHNAILWTAGRLK